MGGADFQLLHFSVIYTIATDGLQYFSRMIRGAENVLKGVII